MRRRFIPYLEKMPLIISPTSLSPYAMILKNDDEEDDDGGDHDPLPNPEPPPGPDPGNNPPIVYPFLPPSGPSGPGK